MVEGNKKLATDVQKFYCSANGKPIGPLAVKQLCASMQVPEVSQTETVGGVKLLFAYLSLQGYYPNDPYKPNQDAFSVSAMQGDSKWFGVFDGHGAEGHKCARFCADKVCRLGEWGSVFFTDPC